MRLVRGCKGSLPITRGTSELRFPLDSYDERINILGVEFINQWQEREVWPRGRNDGLKRCHYTESGRKDFETVLFDSRWFSTAPNCQCPRVCLCLPMCCQIMRICAVVGLDPSRFNAIEFGGQPEFPYYHQMTVVQWGVLACPECTARGYLFY